MINAVSKCLFWKFDKILKVSLRNFKPLRRCKPNADYISTEWDILTKRNAPPSPSFLPRYTFDSPKHPWYYLNWSYWKNKIFPLLFWDFLEMGCCSAINVIQILVFMYFWHSSKNLYYLNVVILIYWWHKF